MHKLDCYSQDRLTAFYYCDRLWQLKTDTSNRYQIITIGKFQTDPKTLTLHESNSLQQQCVTEATNFLPSPLSHLLKSRNVSDTVRSEVLTVALLTNKIFGMWHCVSHIPEDLNIISNFNPWDKENPTPKNPT